MNAVMNFQVPQELWHHLTTINFLRMIPLHGICYVLQISLTYRNNMCNCLMLLSMQNYQTYNSIPKQINMIDSHIHMKPGYTIKSVFTPKRKLFVSVTKL
jgi:hypothetical protein